MTHIFFARPSAVAILLLGTVASAWTQRLPDTPVPATATSGATAQAADSAPAPALFIRLVDFYRDDWNGVAAAAAAKEPAPPRRGLPSPLPSPPFYSADWSYGGSPTIGESDGNVYPLQTAWNGAKGRTKLYGWVEPGANASTSQKRNTPLVDDIYSNRVELSQFVVFVERLPDSVQRDHIDWGFHLTSLYGTDYRQTTNKGYFSSQLINHDRQYGFDPVLEYVDVYFPHVAQGMNLRVGRFLSAPGIESQMANNYMFSHSLLYSVDPFTDTGAIATVQLNPQWILQAEVSASHDVAPWTHDAKPAFTACVSYTTKSVNDNFYTCANGINDGVYAFNNLQQYDQTWYHRFGTNWHMATEAYVMYQREVPSTNGSILPEKGTNGANCRIGLQRCLAPEWAGMNYLNRQLGAHSSLSLRTDFLNDKKGQRTGYVGRYSEETISLTYWLGSTVQIQPEIRFDHAWDHTAYDQGTRRNQFTVATNAVFHF